jgi:UDP-hydrolysing UDP-N-acetyl-D-glucosamine 2-epimerase
MEKYCGRSHDGKLALLTYHPTTLYPEHDLEILDNIFTALMEHKDFLVIATEANADAGGKKINRRLREISERSDRFKVFSSLGQVGYLSVLKASNLVIGNSSSGILEAPSVKIPTINVGDRQTGRIKAVSVIDADGSLASLRSAIEFSFSSEMQHLISRMLSPFGSPGASSSISKILSTVQLENVLVKKFVDH